MNDINLMPTKPQAMMGVLDTLSIPYTLYEHEAVFTVEESHKVDRQIPAQHTRNMFLRTKKKENFLITLCHDTPIDLKKLADMLDVKNFSFGSPDRLMEILGVYPGSVTPFSAMNAKPEDITVVLDQRMMEADTVAYHPLLNTMTVTVTPDDLLKFIRHHGHDPRVMDLSPAAPDA